MEAILVAPRVSTVIFDVTVLKFMIDLFCPWKQKLQEKVIWRK